MKLRTKTMTKTMIIKKLTYIGLALCIAVLSGCSDDITTPNTLSGDGTKTPLEVTALLDANSKAAKTRAADKKFASEDEMVVYLRHVTWGIGTTDDEKAARTPITADQAPRLVTLSSPNLKTWEKDIDDILPFYPDSVVKIDKDNSNAYGVTVSYTNTSGGTNSKLYWDDFSNSNNAETDLRTTGHYLQSYYGYCYNGGTPSTSLSEATGVLGWTILANQTTAEAFQYSDLLWSAEQTPVSYLHRDANTDNSRPGLIIPYTHAMSKVSITVKAGDGFDSNYDFDGTAITLNDVRTTCTADAPNAKLTYSDGKGNVSMMAGTGDKLGTFEAIIVPSILTVGNPFATITNMDGNTYTIPVTEQMVQTATTGKEGWGSQLGPAKEDVNNGTAQVKPQTRANEAQIPAGTGYQMKSGVHYKLTVTVNKTAVNVFATILDWDEVEAEGVAEIHFDNDVKDKDKTVGQMLEDYGFDVYQSADKDDYGPKVTTLRYNKTTGNWKYSPVIYWQGGTPEYFRALSNVRADASGTAANESLIMENGRDALWGTTQGINGYEEGQAVKPRTGDVPLKFYHAMSQITFYLEDALKDNADESARIDLRGATIQLTDLATGGTLDLDNGTITLGTITPGQKTLSEDPGSVPSRMGYFAAKENDVETQYKDNVTLKNYIITPQTISDAATVIITLADGTVYKAQLNKCTIVGASTPTAITEWKRGEHYKYLITLGKETITFRAYVENWVDVDGGGKATLEWD